MSRERATYTFLIGAIVTHWSDTERYRVVSSNRFSTEVETIDGVSISFPTVDLTLAA